MAIHSGYVAECYWAGVSEDDVRRLDQRIGTAIAEHAQARYLGSVLIVDDEVVLCLFDGPFGTVREVLEQAGVAFGRLLRTRRTLPDSSPPAPTGPRDV